MKEEKDEFDEMAEGKSGLSDSAKKFKQTKISFSKASKPKAKVPWTDDEDGSGMKSHVFLLFEINLFVQARLRSLRRRQPRSRLFPVRSRAPGPQPAR